MVDDFEVPGTDYGYDDYGEFGCLSTPYLDDLAHLGMRRFYPSAPKSDETGAQRGCIVLCSDDDTAQMLSRVDGLVPGDAQRP